MSEKGYSQEKEKHVPVLDGIRGLAILLVLIHHFAIAGVTLPDSFPGRVAQGLTQSAWIGVDLFFVLSGFLITGILYDTRESLNYFRAFYARRFLRIFPLYYGFLFVVMAFTRPLQIDWGGRQFLYLTYLDNALIVKHVFSQPLSPFFNLNYLWSLAVEEQFYFVARPGVSPQGPDQDHAASRHAYSLLHWRSDIDGLQEHAARGNLYIHSGPSGFVDDWGAARIGSALAA